MARLSRSFHAAGHGNHAYTCCSGCQSFFGSIAGDITRSNVCCRREGNSTVNNTLKDRAAIITGANQGLGEAIAQAFVQAGASVMLCARDKSKLDNVIANLRSLCDTERQVEAMCADVSKLDDVKRLVSTALTAFPQIHI